MIALPLAALVVVAAAAWLVAVLSAIAIIGMSPPGQRLGNYMKLGFWRFAALEQALGPAAVPHLRRYRTAFLVFFAVILGIIIVALLVTVAQPN